MWVYIRYSKEYPYLPIAVADSPKELGEKLGINPNVVSSSIYHERPTYAKVWVEEDD